MLSDTPEIIETRRDTMPTNLETSIAKSAAAFAAQIVAAVRGATLQELIALQGEADRKGAG